MTTVLESLNQGLHRALGMDERVLVLGEDLLDPYGGAFKVTRGLSSAYPGRVLASPISEAALVGVASGMALRGLRPVVEIMFADFLTLAADQLINHSAKFRWMYNEKVCVPLVIRTPAGGRRGYGPTHSQTLEKHFLGVPGLVVIAPTALGDPGALLETLILHTQDPVLFVENKLLYLQKRHTPGSLADFDLQISGDPPVYTLTLRGAPSAQVTVAAYGYMAELARQAVLALAYEEEIFAELVVPTRLSPTDLVAVSASAGRTGSLVVIEEGTFTLGWGAEVIASAKSALGPVLRRARRVAALDTPVPASGTLEAEVLPGLETIKAAIRLVQR